MTPTQEQRQAIDLFLAGSTLAIEAGAGTGKTSTLAMIGNATRKRGQYIAFNRSIATEAAEKMPRTVACNTAHSLAFREVGKRYAHRLDSGRMRSVDLARKLGIEDSIGISCGTERKVLNAGLLASHVQQACRHFCASADREPSDHHFKYIDGIDPKTTDGKRTFVNNERVRRILLPPLRKFWKDIQDPNGQFRFEHDHYLKLWALGNPTIPGDFLLLDEAQDTTPVLLDVVMHQPSQVVLVGDENQSIYEWRGTINAMTDADVAARTQLTQSFRFGPAVAELANAILANLDTTLRLRGFDKIVSYIGPHQDEDCVLSRTNAVAVKRLMNAQKNGLHPHLVGGGKDVIAFAKAADELQRGRRTIHPELSCFANWGEVQHYVENDPQGSEMKMLTDLVDGFGTDVIIDAIEQMPQERDADLIVSTAHKSKGREWGRVTIAEDFPAEPKSSSEWRLLYVAATRAKNSLDIEACEALTQIAS